MWKLNYLLPNQVNDDYLWTESDLRCLLDRGDSFLLLFLISTRTSFLFKLSAMYRRERYAKKQLLSTLLYLKQVCIFVYLVVVVQVCFHFEARVWLVTNQ